MGADLLTPPFMRRRCRAARQCDLVHVLLLDDDVLLRDATFVAAAVVRIAVPHAVPVTRGGLRAPAGRNGASRPLGPFLEPAAAVAGARVAWPRLLAGAARHPAVLRRHDDAAGAAVKTPFAILGALPVVRPRGLKAIPRHLIWLHFSFTERAAPLTPNSLEHWMASRFKVSQPPQPYGSVLCGHSSLQLT